MTIETSVDIDGAACPVTLSDEEETLLAAKAAGRVVVGLRNAEQPGAWLPVEFVTEPSPIDEHWLGCVARRALGLPWVIAETNRLQIREFTEKDCSCISGDADDSADEAMLKDPKKLAEYRRTQYAFFGCGLWALIRKEDGSFVGTVSVTPEEEGVYALGYHIYKPYRRQGYAKEACACVVSLLKERGNTLIAETDPGNEASVRLLRSLGFDTIAFCGGTRYNGKNIYASINGRKVD